MSNYQLNKGIVNLNIFVSFIFLFSFPSVIFGQDNSSTSGQLQTSFVYRQLCTPNSSDEAKALYKYLQNISGEKILSGQMSTPNGINEIEYIRDVTGKQPAVCGFDLVYENANKKEIQKVIQWWEAGGIPLIMWNWSAPSYDEGLENSRKEIDIDKCFQEGTREYESFRKELKLKADHLDSLRMAKVPVLWSPFHEQNGDMFWWGKQGPEKFIKLWQAMFNYFVKERKLNNLIWVQCFTEDISRDWFPGNNYVDIIATSSYKNTNDPLPEIYNKAKTLANSNTTPLAYNECANMPSPAECKETGAMWCWWMQRADTYLTNLSNEYLNEIYYNNLIVTLNDVPNIVQDYNGETVKRTFISQTTIPFSEFKGFNLGAKSGIFTVKDKQMEIEAKGSGIQGLKDEGYFVFKQMDGDFDISVQVLSLAPINLYTMAGIMARANLSKKSPHVFFQVFPDNNKRENNSGGCELKYRTETSKETITVSPDPNFQGNKFNVDFPDTWIRLKRKGNIFKSYISHDNINWYIYSVHNQEMPNKLLVGIAVSSHNNKVSTKAEFKNLEIAWD